MTRWHLTAVQKGKWRVWVQTENGQKLGRVVFDVEGVNRVVEFE